MFETTPHFVFCLFCTDHYIYLFLDIFWRAVRKLVYVHCPKKIDFLNLFAIYFDFSFNQEHLHVSSELVSRINNETSLHSLNLKDIQLGGYSTEAQILGNSLPPTLGWGCNLSGSVSR
jgi:hypothetical protein